MDCNQKKKRRGKRIRNLVQLQLAARNKQSVTYSCSVLPAAFVMAMQASRVQRLIDRGMFIYIPGSGNPPFRSYRQAFS